MPTADDLEFKELLLTNHLATPTQISECMESLLAYEEAGIGKPLSAIMVDKGYLTVKQVNAVRQLQGKRDEFIVRGYTILETLGQGGLGTVYKARQDSIGRIVALKIMFPQLVNNQDYVKRFMREAHISAQLDHKNIVKGIDFGECEGTYFFAMEYVEGKSLKDILKERGKLEEKEAARIILDIAEALRYAENFSLVHRDIKPENIMITKDGISKLCDLGLAKCMQSDMSMTRTGIIMGTPHYISLEQAIGQKDIDIRSDIYSLGVTFYHLITGDVPYKGDSVVSIISQHLSSPIPSPQEKNSALSNDVCKIIFTMMAKKRENRYQSAQELIVDLKRFLKGDQPLAIAGMEDGKTVEIRQDFERNMESEMLSLLQASKNIASETSSPPSFGIEGVHPTSSGSAKVSSSQNPPVSQVSSSSPEELVANKSSSTSDYDLATVSPQESRNLVANLQQQLEQTKKQHRRLRKFVFLVLLSILLISGWLFAYQKRGALLRLLEKKKEVKVYDFGAAYQIGDLDRKARERFTQELQKLVPTAITPSNLTKDMVLIPGGTYKRSSSADESDESISEEKIAAFWLDQYELSNAKYYRFCQATSHPFPRHWNKDGIPEGLENYPVVNVSFYDAQLYANWAGKRLPTEIEWEYAVRTSQGYNYPWGMKYEEKRANCNTMKIAPVDHFVNGKTSSGLFNMAGNVWEWTSTSYGELQENIVIKGGSYAYPQSYACATYRDAFFPYGSREDIGFRCALSSVSGQ